MRNLIRIVCFTAVLGTLCSAQTSLLGHSKHGKAFDEGFRTRPILLKGIGSAPFPITTQSPEVQQFFNQANALMHNFWWEEAERSLRWCLKLEPQNPMVYWALARTGDGGASPGRYRDFLDQAIRLKAKASLLERRYIEAWETAYTKGAPDPDKVLKRNLEQLVLDFPNDVEAKATLLWAERSDDPFTPELLRNEIRKSNPKHPGILHSTIHEWDYKDPLKALDSSAKYPLSAPRVGHALHMPGHIYSKVGMWHEAARAMDSATRTELRYLNKNLLLPHETWNFQHNRNYLCFIQEQLGMASVALQGARDLLAAPTSPTDENLSGGGLAWQGRSALVRGCLKFERYDELLRPGALKYPDDDMGKGLQAMTECLIYAGKGDAAKARDAFTKAKELIAKMPAIPGLDQQQQDEMNADRDLGQKEMEGLVLLAEGKPVEGKSMLEAAEKVEAKLREKNPIAGDPPDRPWSIARKLGDVLLSEGRAKEAIPYYDKALKYEPNCGFAISGLALAHQAAGNTEKAREYAGRLEYVWSNADADLPRLVKVRALNLGPKPLAYTPRPERPYRPRELASYGPSNWQPFSAPKLECLDINGRRVALENYRGKNVLLVFYIGEACVHCVEQLVKIDARSADFQKLNTTVLAVSSDAFQKNRQSQKLSPLKLNFLSDLEHENARRYASYDDFENLELHSTILIDSKGKVRWKKVGGDPFLDMDYLLREIGRW